MNRDTHLFIDFDESDEAGQQMLAVGKQTCFLHAAMGASYPTNLSAEINGEEMAV